MCDVGLGGVCLSYAVSKCTVPPCYADDLCAFDGCFGFSVKVSVLVLLVFFFRAVVRTNCA